MAKHTNIVDFDEARAASRARRAHGAGAQGARRQPTSEPSRRRAEADEDRQEEGLRRRSGSTASGRSSRTSGESRMGTSSVRRSRSVKGATRDSKSQPKESSARAQGAAKKAADDRDARKRSRNKARADKMFEKQFAAEASASSAEAEGAPRAALYEGQMGSSQRKAARMQRVSEAAPVSAKINPTGWFSNLNISPRTMKVATALICVVLVGVFLYIPARQYYQSVREHDRLEAQYAVIEQRNEVLDEQNDALAGDAGMEDAVREKYGYVRKGDQTAVVSGLSDRTLDTSRDGDEIEANVLTSAVKAPEEWYTPYLDAFFGVS